MPQLGYSASWILNLRWPCLKPRGCENVGPNWHATQSIEWFESDSIFVPIIAIYDGKRTLSNIMNFKWPDHVMFLAELQMESRSEIELRTRAAGESAESGHFSKLHGFGWVSKKKNIMFCRKSLLCWVGLAPYRYLYINLSFNARIAQALEYQGRLVTEVNNLPMVACPTLGKLVCCNEDSSENDVFVW